MRQKKTAPGKQNNDFNIRKIQVVNFFGVYLYSLDSAQSIGTKKMNRLLLPDLGTLHYMWTNKI